MTTFPAYRRIASPDGPLFDSFHRIVKYDQPPCYKVTQVAHTKPLSGYIISTIELESRIEKLMAASERTTRKQFSDKMKEVFNHIK